MSDAQWRYETLATAARNHFIVTMGFLERDDNTEFVEKAVYDLIFFEKRFTPDCYVTSQKLTPSPMSPVALDLPTETIETLVTAVYSEGKFTYGPLGEIDPAAVTYYKLKGTT